MLYSQQLSSNETLIQSDASLHWTRIEFPWNSQAKSVYISLYVSFVCVCIYIYIYIYIYMGEGETEIVDFGKSDKMISISGKVDKSNTDDRFSRFRFFIHSDEVLFPIKKEILIICYQCLVYPLIFIIYNVCKFLNIQLYGIFIGLVTIKC